VADSLPDAGSAGPFLPSSDASGEDLFEAFESWASSRELALYAAQEEAIFELLVDGAHVVLNTPTGSGKSLVAEAVHFAAMTRGERSVYTSPIKALVSEKFFDLCERFGPENVGMMTGDGAVNGDAPILCCTAEILASRALREGDSGFVQHVVMDEFHYYADRDRGTAWQVPLLVLRSTRFLLMSATLGDPARHAEQLEDATGRSAVVVQSDERPVPLDFVWADTPLLETLADLMSGGRSPVYLVSFSQRGANEIAQSLTSTVQLGKETRDRLRTEVRRVRLDTPFGHKLKRLLDHGVGVHHAGLLPKYRRLVERLAQRRLLRVISGTDTLGVGVNVPIRCVLLTRLYKFDGQSTGVLSVRDFKQIAGRAGRRGLDEQGWVVAQAPEHVIENRKNEAKVAAGLMSKKKLRKASEPRGYVRYDEETFTGLQTGTPETLEPVFTLTSGMVLEVLQREPEDCAAGLAVLRELIEVSHGGPTDKAKLNETLEQHVDALLEAGVLDGDKDGDLRLAAEVPEDLSLFHQLSLFVLYALERLPADDPDRHLRILSLVESVLESPHPILRSQTHRERGYAIAAMKEEGLDYHERMERLDDVEYPKPEADLLWRLFDDYLETRPWLAHHHLRPKGVAREMWEDWAGFSEYVKDLKLSGSEGVLLRYLNDVHRMLHRTVGEAWRDEAFEEMVAYLRTLIASTDSSLLEEWERLVAGEDEVAAPQAQVPVGPPRFASVAPRVRAELHLVLRALRAGDWDAAADGLRDGDAAALKDAVRSADLDLDTVRIDHRARLPMRTVVKEEARGLWTVTQQLIDLDEEVVGLLEGSVDLRGGVVSSGPLVTWASLLGV